MTQVILSCVPAIIALEYFFGSGVIIQLLISCTTGILSEILIIKLRRKKLYHNLYDRSYLVTAFLLTVSTPPLNPWWIMVVGTSFAIIVAKHIYGGLGHNIFNPAMVGYIVLLISFPTHMSNWILSKQLPYQFSFTDNFSLIFCGTTSKGVTIKNLNTTIHHITQASPLSELKINLHHNIYNNRLLDNFNCQLNWKAHKEWIWINLSFLLGGIYLVYRKIINWYIPCSILLTILICVSFEKYTISSHVVASFLLHLFFGSLIIGAFFIATDPVTMPASMKGKVVFGILIGLLIWIIRTYSVYPDGIAFAILVANSCVPLIDYYIQPHI